MAALKNERHERFCQEYLVDLNATRAAIRTGYSKKTAGQIGHELLKRPDVQERIAELKAERSERTKIDADWVLAQAVKVHERCMQAEPVMEQVDGEWRETGEYKFEHSGANRALEIIGRHVDVQAFLDKSETKVTGDLAERILRGRKRTG